MHAGPTLPEPTPESIVRAASSSDAASLALLRTALRAQPARLRVLALRASQKRGVLHDEEWVLALEDESAEVRREALSLLARQEWSETVSTHVLESLEDADALVVDAAAFALGEHPDPRFVSALVRAARHRDARCRETAIAALGAIGDRRGLEAIIAGLDDKPPVRRRATVALANFEGPEVDAALSKAASDRDWQVRAAAEQLGD